MSMPNRKTVRSTLATNITAHVTALQAVYGYYPKDFGGQSPVCTIETMPSQYNLKTMPMTQDVDYAITFWALTDGATGSGETAADAEDKLDDLHYALCLMFLQNHYLAEFIQASSIVQFSMESGAVYQSETHFVRLHNAQ
jgi:hypothetical protein